MTAVTEFLAARDFLLQHRSDYATAYAGFKWPKLKEFNWALDYFDTLAKGNDNPALWIIEEDGSEAKDLPVHKHNFDQEWCAALTST